MTYIVFQGMIDRLDKLRRWHAGVGQTEEERLLEKLEEMKELDR